MPELPEVESIARGLAQVIPGTTIRSVKLMRSDIFHQPAGQNTDINSITGKKIATVARRAKRLIIALSDGSALLIQLGMTGRFIITEPETDMEKHAHFTITLSNGKDLRFIDHRRFGRVWLFEQLDHANPDAGMLNAGMGKLGPEPFGLKTADFSAILHSQRHIKAVLLDQTKIAGLGNIYADESLFAAGIHPATIASKITPEKAAALLKEIKAVLKKSIAAGGTSFSDYRDAYGRKGGFLKMLKVYQRTGLPCPSCTTKIDKTTIAGRSTHFCPKCQK
ncbi:MAG: bifunctional DNA-formamidopyrimidine glycosylase/DNA-(apurinic or apyrimidinic site) lyase [Sedimentisphaerales bacterium]|nr:bifunctional DNA-formamidopyrimidine glycosylase/DNA-(apurinic or apyrimidinic site) lyase [Sedimentisphaerales bacterium]